MEVTGKNYYSQEVDAEYMSHSQYLRYAGHMGVVGCEARAVAMARGEWVEETSKAMLVGSYVDAYFEGTLDEFKTEHPEIFTAKGELRAEYKQAEKMIKRCEESKYFMDTMSGEKQKIMTGELFGSKWRIKMDSYIPGKAIVDLKTSSDIHKSYNVEGKRATFIDYWGYYIQLAIYQKIVEQNTGKKLPCFISVVTKEEYPEALSIRIPQEAMDEALEEVEQNMPAILAVKAGQTEPMRCEKCNYCKSTRVQLKALQPDDLID